MKELNNAELERINGGACAPDGEDSFMCDVGQKAHEIWDSVRGNN
ncbi:bacteriocin [Staphylococcus pragensis]|uniref:Bacteriocin n=1 Tax=Staphylococcus pragensis TaxID=1611836 RepID=A0A4Z1B960_9STAP|nr:MULTISPECIES: bacteriocin [Staphylococcus]RTX91963.1 bacteriocin [Staphylococcus carnosus]TGN26958.1 bacteriocin [Staphylococcus pragensis]GGG94183.1 hypothetical protein GCM10007342_16610 [Staphylococcus pragensis]